MTATEAIARSISRSEIVTIDYDADAAATLQAACDDSAQSDSVTEYWGTEDGSEWRVHVREEGAK